eukprot:NODE_14469_length_1107_cov_6.933673.p3 GENE.NODE_14469_length_1107_cov_6.933673~~NODE_14469_length_1107_cov_6.933673.p3  ORF type:complete len:97 (-),score=35.72 NODE_14469_length_1107_cov_6.933673:3-293(-)
MGAMGARSERRRDDADKKTQSRKPRHTESGQGDNMWLFEAISLREKKKKKKKKNSALKLYLKKKKKRRRTSTETNIIAQSQKKKTKQNRSDKNIRH